jgi:hypothetical protein
MPSTRDAIAKRFQELAHQATQVPLNRASGSETRAADTGPFYAWSGSALNLLCGVFGEQSPHALRFKRQLDAITNNYVNEKAFEAVRGVFLGAKADFDGGHMFNVQATIAGELFGDFVSAAKAALAEGQHTVAAVLASAALEDALKRHATLNNLDVSGKSMKEVVNALKSQGLVTGAQKSLLDSMPKVRDYAMHAEWDKLTPQDAGSVIGYVEQFLLTNFQ